MHPNPLKDFEFELAYLALLTRDGLKPLSRWEKPFDRSVEEALHALDLKTRVVERTVRTGQRTRELLLSGHDDCLARYASRFEGTPIRRSRHDMRIEGLLFGYPSCCVESYAARGYAQNSLRRRDQRILFHWACPHCAVTPLLLPHYHRICRACREARASGSKLLAPRFRETGLATQWRRSVARAASVMALGAVPLLGHTAPAPDPLDPHVLALPAADDPDLDYLATAEEGILGMDPHQFDENGNAIPDGMDLARQLSAAIEALPTEPSATHPYVTHYLLRGVEICEVCKATANMGYMVITHPLEDQEIRVRYIAKHYLEHGGFSFAGDLTSGRLNPALLKLLVTGDGLGHFLPLAAMDDDPDNDGLRSREEPEFGTDPAVRDTDGDQLIDGIDVARELRGQLEVLPRFLRPEDGPRDRVFVVEHPMDGIEICPRCGERVVMDIWDVINPVSHTSILVSSMALHYLQHGTFGWEGGQLLGGAGRVDPLHLKAVLSGQGDGHWLPVVGDGDADGLLDGEEIHFGTMPENPDSDGDGVPDGVALARRMHARLGRLPDRQQANGIYVTHCVANCFAPCPVCGVDLNCGHLILTNVWAESSLTISYLNAHYLEHGSFAASATERIDPVRLEALLRPGVCITSGAQDITLRWPGQPGRIYQMFTAPELAGPWTPGPVFPGEGREIVCQLERGADAPRQFFKITVQ